MTRGETATHIFNTNTDLTGATVYVSYFQRGRRVIEKTNRDIMIESDKITVGLSQKDTLRLSAEVPVSIQIRYIRANGVASVSNIMTANINDVLKEGVIEYGR